MEKLSLSEMQACAGGGVILFTGLNKVDGDFSQAHVVIGPDAATHGASTALEQIVVKNGMNLSNIGILITP